MTTESESSNFLRTQIENDLESGRYQEIVTRFPPEPNGFLHIGHAKAICVDFGLAEEFGGRCHLRFDDTNPLKEDRRYAEAIEEDIRWLGFDWGEHLHHASDYFPQLFAWAVRLIEEGKAYVDSLSEEEIRAYRGTVTEPGRPSPYRERPIEENLRLFREMQAGVHPEGSHVLRAKADMAHPNMKMRDPLMYRILRVAHHHAGADWNVYPFYDYAHGLSDAIEGVTHSICTLEFENNRALYDFFVELVGFTEPRPHQYEMARLKLPYTVVSKRRLKPLVESGVVAGWDDPRMSTLAGLRNRGVPAEAIRSFVERIGVSKANSIIDPTLLDNAIRDHLNPRVKRLMAVLDPMEVEITNGPGDTEWLDASLYPHDVPLEGSRRLPFGSRVLIERTDFQEEPERGFRRLAPGRTIRLRYGYLITCTGVERDEEGNVVKVLATYDPRTRGGKAVDDTKVWATIHWVAADEARPARLLQVGSLFTKAYLDGEKDVTPWLDPDSLQEVDARVEPALAEVEPGDRVQLERTGYYYFNPRHAPDLVLTRIVGLTSDWRLEEERPEVKVGDPTLREWTVEELALIDALEARGIGADDAKVLVDDAALRERIDRLVGFGVQAADASKWCIHELPKVEATVDDEALAKLIGLVATGAITHKIGRDVLAVLATEGGDPEAIIDARGWRPIGDDAALAKMVDDVLAANPGEAAAWRGGKDRLKGFFVGQVMKASRGRADARKVNALLDARKEA